MRTILTLLLITITTAGFTQTLSYNDLQTIEKLEKQKISSYTTENGLTVNVGDTISFGEPGNGLNYLHIKKFIVRTGPPGHNIAPNECNITKKSVVKSFEVKKNKSNDKYFATMYTGEEEKTTFGEDYYLINIEDALKSKEILLK